MNAVIELLKRHPTEATLGLACGIVLYLLALGVLRIRLGYPAIAFACLFALLMGATSYGFLQTVGKGLMRWIGLAAMAGMGVLHVRYAGARVNRPTAVHWGALIVIVFAICLIPLSRYRRFTALNTASVAMLFAGSLGGAWLYTATPQRLMEMTSLLWKLFVSVLALGFAFIAVPGIPTGAGSRFSGFFNNPNWNGIFAAMFLPLCLWNIRYARTVWQRRWAKLAMAAGAVTVVWSGSRGAIVGGAAAGVLTAYKLDRARLMRNAALLAAGLALIAVSQAGREYLEARAERLARVDRLATLTHRTDMWRDAWPAVRRTLPWGAGLGNSRFALLSEAEAEQAASEIGAVAAHVHSQHLAVAGELGVIGIAMLWAFMIHLTAKGLRCMRLPNTPLADLSVALFGCCVVVFADSFLHGWMLSAGSAYALTFWMIVALLLKSERMARWEMRLEAAPVQGGGA